MHGGVINAGPVAKKLNLPGIMNQTESSQLARDLELAAATGVHTMLAMCRLGKALT